MPVTTTGPFFLSDIFSGDIKDPNFGALVRATNVVGAIIKVTQGVSYDTRWFHDQWPRAMEAGGVRYGSTWFRGAYHFGVPDVSGDKQADFALDTIERAGGWHDGDMPLAWDIEGDAWHDDKKLRRKVSMEFAQRVLQRTGRRAEFYGNGDIGIGPDDGFGQLWTPHPKRLGSWPVARWNLYQYAGDGEYYDPSGIPAKKKFPLYIPGWGQPPGEDMNTVLENGVTVKDVTKLKGRLTGKC